MGHLNIGKISLDYLLMTHEMTDVRAAIQLFIKFDIWSLNSLIFDIAFYVTKSIETTNDRELKKPTKHPSDSFVSFEIFVIHVRTSVGCICADCIKPNNKTIERLESLTRYKLTQNKMAQNISGASTVPKVKHLQLVMHVKFCHFIVRFGHCNSHYNNKIRVKREYMALFFSYLRWPSINSCLRHQHHLSWRRLLRKTWQNGSAFLLKTTNGKKYFLCIRFFFGWGKNIWFDNNWQME